MSGSIGSRGRSAADYRRITQKEVFEHLSAAELQEWLKAHNVTEEDTLKLFERLDGFSILYLRTSSVPGERDEITELFGLLQPQPPDLRIREMHFRSLILGIKANDHRQNTTASGSSARSNGRSQLASALERQIQSPTAPVGSSSFQSPYSAAVQNLDQAAPIPATKDVIVFFLTKAGLTEYPKEDKNLSRVRRWYGPDSGNILGYLMGVSQFGLSLSIDENEPFFPQVS
jgi:hypothetical protein